MPDFLVDFFSEKRGRSSSSEFTTTRKEWLPKPVSYSKINFNLNVSQKETFSALEEVLRCKLFSTGSVQLAPEFSTSLPICPKCSTTCIEQRSQARCFLKKNVFECEGKYKSMGIS